MKKTVKKWGDCVDCFHLEYRKKHMPAGCVAWCKLQGNVNPIFFTKEDLQKRRNNTSDVPGCPQVGIPTPQEEWMFKKKPTRGELLDKYCKREPTQFMQYDVFLGKPNDGKDDERRIDKYDKDGDFLVCGESWELMHGSDVRVLIKPCTSAKVASRILKKISKWAKTGEREHHRAAMLAEQVKQAKQDAEPF